MNTEIFKAVALTILSVTIIVAGLRGIRARRIAFGLGGGKTGSAKPVLTVELFDISAQVTSLFYVMAGVFMLSAVGLSVWYEGQDRDMLIKIFTGGSIAIMIFGLFVGTVSQAAINVGEQLRKRSTSTAHQNDDSSE